MTEINYHKSQTSMCNCVGPQNGQPKCPCMMKGLIQRDGRWIEPEKDLGPVRDNIHNTPHPWNDLKGVLR